VTRERAVSVSRRAISTSASATVAPSPRKVVHEVCASWVIVQTRNDTGVPRPALRCALEGHTSEELVYGPTRVFMSVVISDAASARL